MKLDFLHKIAPSKCIYSVTLDHRISWLELTIASFPAPLIFRYYLPLSTIIQNIINMNLILHSVLELW
jgi:hypothetical protein